MEDSREEKDNFLDFIPIKSPFNVKELQVRQEEDKACQEIKRRLKSKEPERSEKLASYKMLGNILYVTRHKTRAGQTETHLVPYLPDSLVDQAFKVVHEEATAGHHDLKRTLKLFIRNYYNCLLYTSPSPRDKRQSRMPSSA